MFTDEEDAHVMRHYLGVDLLVDGSLGFLLLLNGQQVHQRTDGHPLHRHATQTRRNNDNKDLITDKENTVTQLLLHSCAHTHTEDFIRCIEASKSSSINS